MDSKQVPNERIQNKAGTMPSAYRTDNFPGATQRPRADARGVYSSYTTHKKKPVLSTSWQNWQCLSPAARGLTMLLVIFLLLSAVGGALLYSKFLHSVTVYRLSTPQQTNLDAGGGGIVYPRQEFDLTYPAAERVQDVMVKVGDYVKSGQPLVKIDSTQLNAQVTQAADDVTAAQNYLNSINGSGTSVNIAQAQQALQVAQNHYNALAAQSSSANFHNGVFSAPINGVVTTVNVAPGNTSQVGQAMLIITDQSTVTVHAKFSLSMLKQIHNGLAAVVTPSALPDQSVTGVVSAVIPKADPQTDTFDVWVEIAKPQQVVLPGMSAFVNVQLPTTAYAVPREAVLNPDHESAVFIVRNNHVYLTRIQVVNRSADRVYIQGNLHPGDMLAAVPIDSLHDGQSVEISQIEN